MRNPLLLSALLLTPLAASAQAPPREGALTALLTTPWTEEAKAAATPWNEYPRPQMSRASWVNLNGDWDYLGGSDKANPLEASNDYPHFPEHPEHIKVPFAPESYLSGIMRKQEINMWYRRPFLLPIDWTGKRVLLHFDAVSCQAAVYVNGKVAGKHEGSWDAFELDITDLLKNGQNGENELVVGVRDEHDGLHSCGKGSVNQGDYTFTSGIWQTVWLEPVDRSHIEKLEITPDLKHSVVKLGARIAGTAHQIRYTIREGEKVVRQATSKSTDEIEVPIPHPHTWSPADPFLYDLKVELLDDQGKTLDEVGSYFGMRSIELATIAGKLRPALNGKFVFQLGPLDQGYWPDGIHTAPTDSALKSDLEVIKRLGFNLVRKHAKLEPQRFYYWADKLGLMVWQDMPSMWYPEKQPEICRPQFEKEWQTIMEQHHNSPAIVAWVPFNENWGAYDVVRMTAWTKKMDPSRLVSGNSGYNNAPGYRKAPGDPHNGDFDDLHLYVGPGDPPQPSLTRAAALGEYGGVGLEAPGHMWPVKTGAYDMKPDVDALTKCYEGLQKDLTALVTNKGLGAAIYTQTTDVEHEINGFLTYDRKFEKMDFARVRAANEAVLKAADQINAAEGASKK